MGRFEYLIEKQRRERRLSRLVAEFKPLAPETLVAEWRPAPLGRLGRMLWKDIDRYLEFVEIARAPAAAADSEPRSDGRAMTATYSIRR